MTQITLAKGITMGLRKAMERDPKVLVMGEDVGKLGGVFRVTDGLQKDFGEQRVLAMPDPEPVTMFDNAYPTGSAEVDAERAWFEQYQASFEGSAH